MSLKVIVLVSLIGVALSAPTDPYKHLEKKEPKPYAFSYGVQDNYAGTNFGQEEQSDGNLVHGSYTVQLPDGRKQTVNYKADHYNGFVADVSYYGEAQYPSKSEHPPFVVKPTYHADLPKYKPHKPEPAYPAHALPVYEVPHH